MLTRESEYDTAISWMGNLKSPKYPDNVRQAENRREGHDEQGTSRSPSNDRCEIKK
jgi:hypothetical protein